MSDNDIVVAPKLERAVRQIAETRLGAEPALTLRADTPLIDLGIMDSLAIFELVAFIETEFGVAVPHEALVPENFQSLAALTNLVAMLESTAS